MENKKMTKKEKFNTLINIVTDLEIDENQKEMLLDFMEHEIDLLKKKNSHKSDKPNKKQAATNLLAEKIYNEMEESVYYSSKELTEKYEISVQKLTPIMTHFIKEGLISKGKVKGKVVYFKGEEPKGE
jgi:ribosomal protein S25